MTDDKEWKLKTDVMHKDVEAHRKLETWGLSLFIGAIGLLTRQLVEWGKPQAVEQAIGKMPLGVALAPIAVGIVGFVFLRLVNERSSTLGHAFRVMAGEGFPKKNAPAGVLALFMAMMPFLLGIAGSVLLAWNGIYSPTLTWVCTAAAAGLLLAAFFVWRNRELRALQQAELEKLLPKPQP
jgi:hypothetical protein